MAPLSRQYDIVVFGATGYTGKLCAEYIAESLPTDVKWAVAGRSRSKLDAVVEEVRRLNPDRAAPAVELAQLEKEDLHALARKTRLIVTTVGPYALYGEVVVEACASNGTHYVDVTGETPWTLDMIRKYHDKAKTTGAIIIHNLGIESVPADLAVWSLVNFIREKYSVGTKEVIASMALFSAPSGGTLATIFSILEVYNVKQLAEAFKPWVLSPIPRRAKSPSPFGVLGVGSHPDLGIMTKSIAANCDRAIVQRSWGLIEEGKVYGENFDFSEHMHVKSWALGYAISVALAFGMVALAISPFRWLAKKFVYGPGEGRTKEETAKESIEYRAVGYPDLETPSKKRALSKVKWSGGIYQLTAIFADEAAMAILRDDTYAKKLGGGILTPATLGQPFVDRLEKAGVKFETKLVED